MEFNNTTEAEVAIPATLQINLPAVETLEKVASKMERTVAGIVITSPAMYEIAAQELQSIQGKLEDLTESRMKITRPIDASKKAILELFRGPSERCEAAIAFLKKGMLEWTQAERARKAEEQKKLDEAARLERLAAQQRLLQEQADAERKRREVHEAAKAAVEAEQRALEAAAKGDVEAEKEAAAEATRLQQEQERAQSEANAATERARVTEQVNSMATRAVAAPETKAKGVTTAAPWVAELVDESDATKMLLIRYVAEHPEYVNFLTVNLPPITALAKAMRENCKIPGVVARQRESIRSRRS